MTTLAAVATLRSAPQLRQVPGRTIRIGFRAAAQHRVASLTPRQKQVLDMLLDGQPSKNIAADLCISQRTVESHRAAISRKVGAKSLPELVQLALCARCRGEETFPVTSFSPEVGNTSPHIDAAGPACACIAQGHEPEDLRFNINEVQHRVKNMVAVILSLSRQTMRQSGTKEDFDAKFSARLSAFCSSLDLLISNEWRGVCVRDLIQSQLAPFGILDDRRISASGPTLKLTAKAAHSIGLAVHELATNAVKYGALSVPDGHVVLTWSLTGDSNRQRFQMNWREVDGPRVNAPTRHGFGRQVIQHLTALALSAEVAHQFPADGVRWVLDMPVDAAVVVDTAEVFPLARPALAVHA